MRTWAARPARRLTGATDWPYPPEIHASRAGRTSRPDRLFMPVVGGDLGLLRHAVTTLSAEGFRALEGFRAAPPDAGGYR